METTRKLRHRLKLFKERERYSWPEIEKLSKLKLSWLQNFVHNRSVGYRIDKVLMLSNFLDRMEKRKFMHK